MQYSHSPNYPSSSSAFLCKQCHKGYMQAQIEEGETEFTEHYRCGHCRRQDTIASPIDIVSQLITGLLGLGISLYLALEGVVQLQHGWQTGQAIDLSLAQAGPVAIAALFAFAFIYLLYRGCMALLKRRSYTRIDVRAR